MADERGSVAEARDFSRGSRVGKYTIIAHIGEGGFGQVYLAEERPPVKRRVALKVITAGMNTREFIARFEAERQAMAVMNHPNIAKVHDSGETQRGLPYYTMEYVPGEEITTFCDKHRLKIDERLRVHLQVCDALEHAHQKAIIHRDVKPSNILVVQKNRKAEVKLIDFGLAKALGGGPLSPHTIYSEPGRWMGTPWYISPEQAKGEDVDTRTDIYALGVMLYELLTGSKPFDGDTPHQIVDNVISEDAEPPSKRLRNLGWSDASDKRGVPRHSALVRRVRGDLDWIVMKALEKDRDRRYSSASEFAADIQRHLNNEPILAGSPSNAVRISKFVRRHKVSVLAASTITLVLFAGIAGTSWAAHLAANERDKARLDQARLRIVLAEKYNESDKRVSLLRESLDVFRTLGARSEEALSLILLAREYFDGDQRELAFDLLDEVKSIAYSIREEQGNVFLLDGWFDRPPGTVDEDLFAYTVQHLIEEALYVRFEYLAAAGSVEEAVHFAMELAKEIEESRLSAAEELEIHDTGNGVRVVSPKWFSELDDIVGFLRRWRREPEAITILEVMLRKYREFLRASPADLGWLIEHGTLIESKRLDDAEAFYAEVEAILKESSDVISTFGEAHAIDQIEAYTALYNAWKKPEMARPYVVELIARRTELAGRSEASAGALNECAWLLLTCDPPDLRDPEAALPVALEANEMTEHKNPANLDTLSLAYHLTGDTAKAIENQKEAIALLSPGESSLRTSLETALADFEATLTEEQLPTEQEAVASDKAGQSSSDKTQDE